MKIKNNSILGTNQHSECFLRNRKNDACKSAEVQKIAEENKGLAQETLELLLSGLIRDYNDFLDSKHNPKDPNQPNI